MARKVYRTIDTPQENGFGEAMYIGDWQDLTLQYTGSFSLTVSLQATLGDASASGQWFDVPQSSATSGLIMDFPWKNVRAIRTKIANYVSGDVVAIIGGIDRSD
jgi:hypothetical protein